GAAEPDHDRSGTGLHHVAAVRGRSTHGARVAGRMHAGRARAVACIGGAGIAVVHAGRAARLEGVGRTGGARAAAGFGHVTLVHGRAAQRARVARRVLAGHVGAITLVERAGVGVGGAGRPARLLDVGRAGGARPRAGFGDVTLPGGRAARDARVPRGMRAGRTRAVAGVGGAGVAVVRAPRAARLGDVRRAGRADAVTGLCHV